MIIPWCILLSLLQQQQEILKVLTSIWSDEDALFLHFENSWFLHWPTSNSPASVTAITQEILKSLPHYQGRSSPWAFVTLWFFHLHHFLPSLLQQQDRQFWTNIFSLILVTSALASISPTYVATTTITGNSEVFSTLTEWTTIFSLRFEKSCLLQRHQFLPRPPLLQQQHRKVWSRKQSMERTNIISLRFENLWLLQRHQFLPARLSLLQQQQQQEEILKL